MEGVHDVLRGGGYTGGVGLPAESPHLGLHLRGAAGHTSRTYLQVDAWMRGVRGAGTERDR